MKHNRVHEMKTPDHPAYIMALTGEAITYRQLEERANQCSQFFWDIGLRPGDHIAIFMENNSRFLEIVSGASGAGLVYTAISTHLTASEIEYIVNDCAARIFVTSHAKRDIAAELAGSMPDVHTRLMVGGTIAGYDSYEKKTRGYPSTPIANETIGKAMLYSSGTTGRPKGVVNIADETPPETVPQSALGLMLLYSFTPDTVYLSPAPLYHSAPLNFCLMILALGGTVIIMDRFEATEALHLIETYRVTHSQWVPTMFIRMLKLPEQQRHRFDLSSLKVAIHAAAPCPIPVKQQMIDWWGPVIFEYYAGTEANGFVAINTEEWLTHKGSVGKAIFGVIHILDDQGNELPSGEAGSIYMADGNRFAYHNDPKKTESSRNDQGWSTMGDVGFLDEEGFLYLTDRKADMIISGGVNIYPQETENLLVTHLQVADAAVFGIPNEDFGEEVKAVVQPINMAEAGPELEQLLIAFCQENLSRIKCPRSIDFQEQLPRYPTGKLFKRLLKEPYWKDASLVGGLSKEEAP
ncbi:MAG: AMP-binding protein [Desulfobacterales bacterium]